MTQKLCWMKNDRIRAATLLCSIVAVGACLLPAATQAQEAVVETVIVPDPPSALRVPAPALSAAQREFMLQQKRKIQLRAARSTVSRVGPRGLPPVIGQPTVPIDAEDARFPRPPGSQIVYRNKPNPPTTSQSTLAEPAVANNGKQVLATGNFTHWEFSNNRGATWTKNTFPGGPSATPFPCCDNDVIHDRGRGVTFLSTLYVNAALTEGRVRIYVFRNIHTGANCSYTLAYGTGVLPDYPHLGKSNQFLYLTTNNIGPGGQAHIRRYNIDQMADCVTASGSAWNLNDRATVGQRVVTPADGATETQYFSWAENSTQIRIFSWTDGGTIGNVLRTISASTFGNPDCRGGAQNNDFTDDLWASIHGFNRRGAVGGGRVYFYWNVAADGSHPNGHIHSAIFTEAGLVLLAQTPMWFSGQCNGIPGIATNDRGDLGISTAVGGKAGGGGTAARGYIAISDDYASTIGFFPLATLTAAGTHNRTDQRYGDYFGIHRNNPCGDSYTAMNYALNGGTSTANVNSRFIQFGRGRDKGCVDEYRGSAPKLQ